jgi:hypothetical protein
MADAFAATALVGQQVALLLLAKLVDKEIISPTVAADVLDDVLLELEEWQTLFPDLQTGFEFAREHLSTVIGNYRAMPQKRP